MKKAIKIIAFVMGIIMILSSLFIIRACSAPPEYAEVRERVETLIKASHDVNDVVWGKGLDTYERVYKPSMSVVESDEKYVNDEGVTRPIEYYCYQTLDKEHKIYAFSKVYENASKFSYAYVSEKKLDADALRELFPKETEHADSELYYTQVFYDAESGKYAYCIPYTEPIFEFYYSTDTNEDPEDYDYVLFNSKFNSINAIKDFVRTVYADEYADKLDSTLFDGVIEGSFLSKARYTTNDKGLLSLNTYEPKFEERRVYNFETAQIVRNSSNNKEILVEIETYLPSEPDEKVVAKIYFVLEDGQWFLSTPTY